MQIKGDVVCKAGLCMVATIIMKCRTLMDIVCTLLAYTGLIKLDYPTHLFLQYSLSTAMFIPHNRQPAED